MNRATSRRVYTFAHTFAVADSSAKRASEVSGGSIYHSMNAIVYSAFTLEAFMNHLGAIKVPNWLKETRQRSTYAKLKILSSTLNLGIDFDDVFKARPYLSFQRAFCLRNLIAHGKTENLDLTKPHDFGTMEELKVPLTEWESLCTPERALCIVNDTRQILDELYKAAGFGSSVPLFVLSENV